jgi:hypothetical protein
MIVINLDKSKEIAHQLRRNQRLSEFEPLDNTIARRIPGTDIAAVEAQRQAIRDKYATMQEMIDAANTFREIKVAIAEIAPVTTATAPSGNIPSSTI